MPSDPHKHPDARTRDASSPLDRAAAAYVFGVMPGDESEATEQELRDMASAVLAASGCQEEIERLREALARAQEAAFDEHAEVSRLREALQWIADHEHDEDAIAERSVCPNEFHTTRMPAEDAWCPDCFSRWWATDGTLPSAEGNYAMGAVAREALEAGGPDA